MKKLKCSRAFSLMELVMVLGLLAVLSISAIPAITNTQSVNLDGAARKLEGDLRYAQNLATTTGNDYGLRTTAPNAGVISGYEVYDVVSGQPVSSPYDHLPMTENLSDDFDGITLNDSLDIQFDDQGNPTYVDGDGTVTVANESGETKDIVVSSTGLINIQ